MLLLHWDSFAIAWFLLFGLCVGSFLNVVIFRIPHGFSVGLPSRSACMRCRRKLSVFENIPVLSWVALRGECSGCRSPISPRYPVVESLTAALFVAMYCSFGMRFATLYYCFFAASLVAITFIDIDHRIIPDVISFPGIAIGLLGSHWTEWLGLKDSLLGVVIGGGSFWFLGWAYEKVRKQEGLGFGDVKLLAMIGAFLGARGVLGTIVISSIAGSVVGLILMVAQKKDLKLSIPYGPFLAIGALTFLFWGDYLAFRIYPQ